MSTAFVIDGKINIQTGKVVEELDKTKRKIKEVGEQEEKTENKTKSFKERLSGAVSAIGGFISSTAIVGFFKECTQGAINATTANAKMTEVLKSASKATDSQIDSLKQYAVELSKTGVISAGLNKTAMTQLSTFGLTTDSIKTLIPQLDNLAVNQKGKFMLAC